MKKYQEEEEQVEGRGSDNTGYNIATALQIRLDTSKVVRQLELYLTGQREVIKVDKEGNPYATIEKVGERLANGRGIQSVMRFVETTFNTQVVQGNFDEEMYFTFLMRRRKALADILMINLYNYDIDEQHYNEIIDNIMGFLEPFISRLINNKERESYAQTIQHRETSSSAVRGKGWNPPFMGGG